MEIKFSSRRPAITAALGLVLFANLGIQFWPFVSPQSLRTSFYMQLFLEQFLFILLPPLLYVQGHPGQRPALRMRRLPLSGALSLALAAVFTSIALNLVSYLWSLALDALGIPFISSSLPAPTTLVEQVLLLLLVGCLPALGEEFLFRGVTLSAMEAPGTRRAVLWSSLLFALMHGQIGALPAHVILSLLLATALVGYGSLWAPMVFHAAFNGFNVLLSLLQGAAPPAQLPTLTAVQTILAGLPLWAACGMLAYALFWLPMRAAIHRSPPVVYAPTSAGFPRQAIPLMVALLALFAVQYVVYIRVALSMLEGVS